MNHFWKFIDKPTVHNKADPDAPVHEERTLVLNGTIAEDSWLDDEVTPQAFKDELNAGTGDITVWINSPGGDCFAAASIYNMLMDYKGKVTVKIDGLAASAASVIAMAGDKVLVSPVSMIMIHNPATIAMGDQEDMQKAIEMLDSVKNSIINAYASRTGLSRNKLSKLMSEETWMDATKAIELGFADEIMKRSYSEEKEENDDQITDDASGKTADETAVSAVSENGCLYSSRRMAETFTNKVTAYIHQHQNRPQIQNSSQEPVHLKCPKMNEELDNPVNKPKTDVPEETGASKYQIKALEQRLLFMKSLIGTNGASERDIVPGREGR